MSLPLDSWTRKKAAGKGPYPKFVDAFAEIVRKRDWKPMDVTAMFQARAALTLCKLLCFVKIYEVDVVERWIARKSSVFSKLSKEQHPYLQMYWQHHPREHVIFDGRDETPYPLDDLRMVYSMARHSETLAGTARYAPLREVLDPTRHALLSNPKASRQNKLSY